MARSIPRELPAEQRSIPLPWPWRIRWVSPPAGDGLLWAQVYQRGKADLPAFFAFGLDLRAATIGAAVTLSSLPEELRASRKIHASNPLSLPDGGVELILTANEERAFRLTADAAGGIRDAVALPALAVGKRLIELRAAGDARIVSYQTGASAFHQCLEADGSVRWRVPGALIGATARFAAVATDRSLAVHRMEDGTVARQISLAGTTTLQIWERFDLAILGADPGDEAGIADADFLQQNTSQTVRAIELESGEERFRAPGIASWRHPDAPVLCVAARNRRYHREAWRYDERGGVVGHREYEAPGGEEHRIVAIEGDRILVTRFADREVLRCETIADPIEAIWERALWPASAGSRPSNHQFHAHNGTVLVAEEHGLKLTLLSPG